MPGAIEEVIVVGERLDEAIPQDLQQFGNLVEVITADDLQLGGFNDVAQGLQMKVRGLYLAPKNGDSTMWVARFRARDARTSSG